MKIVHIATSRYGGAGRAAFRQHEALLKAGVDSWFLSVDDSEGNVAGEQWKTSMLQQTIMLQPTTKIKFWKRWLQKPVKVLDLVALFQSIQPKLRCEAATLPYGNTDLHNHSLIHEADIINLHWVAGLLDYPTFFNQVDKPIVWTLHDMQPFSGLFHYKDDAFSNLAIAGEIDQKIISLKKNTMLEIKAGHFLVAPSKWLLHEAQQSSPMRNWQGSVIPYSIDIDLFRQYDQQDARRFLGLPLDQSLLLFVSKHLQVQRKGFSIITQALTRLGIPNLGIVAIGHPDGWVPAQQLNCYLPGLVQNDETLALYYAAADAVVIPSLEDNLPNILLEAISCGVPVLVAPVGGLLEHVSQNPELGLVAKSAAVESFTEIFSQWYQNKESYNPDTIRNYALQYFAPSKQAKMYTDLYSSLCE